MMLRYPDNTSPLPSRLTLRLRMAARISVGDADLLASVEARRKVNGAWGEWKPVVGLIDGDGAIWCGEGCVVELRCAGHTALSLEDDVAPEALPNAREVRSALAWLGLSTTGSRAELDARLGGAP